jgi:predicted O-methyltransferase YrrM
MTLVRSLAAAAYRRGAALDLSHCTYGPMPHDPTGAQQVMPYYRLLAGLADLVQARTVLEIGTYHGGSTLALRAGMGDRAGVLVTVDPTRHENARLDADPSVTRITAPFPGAEGEAAVGDRLGGRRVDILYVDALKDEGFLMGALAAAAPYRPRIVVLDDIAASGSMERAWRRLARRHAHAVAVCDLLEGVRNIEFDMGVIVLDETVFTEHAERIRSTNADFSRVTVGPPYAFDLRASHPQVRTMMTAEETGMLHRLVLEGMTGVGQIVDAGAFLGASTVCFGLAAAARGLPPTTRIHAYDRFTNADPYFDKFLTDPVPRYGSFLDVVARNVDPVVRHVNLYPGNFAAAGWIGRPIEVFFADIAKTVALNARLYEAFASSWIPGHTVYVQQDFVHMETPWIQVAIAFLIDHFTLIGVEPPSLYLGVVSQPPEDRIRRIADDDFEPMERVHLVRDLAGRFEHVETRRTLELIAARLAHDAGDDDLAGRLLAACQADEGFARSARGRTRLKRAAVLTGRAAG